MKILLTEYSADSETEGVVKFDGHVIEGATALWCAILLRSLLFLMSGHLCIDNFQTLSAPFFTTNLKSG